MDQQQYLKAIWSTQQQQNKNMTPMATGMNDGFSSGSPNSAPQQALPGYAMKGAPHAEQ
jgi:hypothetical protein